MSAIIFSCMFPAYEVSCIYESRDLVWVGYGTRKKSRSAGIGYESGEEAVGCPNGWKRRGVNQWQQFVQKCSNEI